MAREHSQRALMTMDSSPASFPAQISSHMGLCATRKAALHRSMYRVLPQPPQMPLTQALRSLAVTTTPSLYITAFCARASGLLPAFDLPTPAPNTHNTH